MIEFGEEKKEITSGISKKSVDNANFQSEGTLYGYYKDRFYTWHAMP